MYLYSFKVYDRNPMHLPCDSIVIRSKICNPANLLNESLAFKLHIIEMISEA